MNDLDLLSIGDASLDVFITPSESETFCQLDDKECLLCFTYGDKIPVKSLNFSIGGNAANNAVGAKRLGVNSGVVLTLGDDDIGNQIVEKMIKEGVDTSYVFRQKDTASNYSSIVVVSGERTIFSYKFPREYEMPPELPKMSWVYLTSMGKSFEAVYSKVVDYAKKNPDVKVAFNPGSRQIRAGLDKIKDVLSVAFVVYVNRYEAEVITGMKDTQNKEKELLEALSRMGSKVPIVTDGVNGSFMYDGGRFIKAGVLPVDSYERTGAGDAFGSGCISALIKGETLEEALLWGTVNSASVIGYAGAQKGLLTENKIQEWLERARSSGVKVEEF
jgi:sugar/nucleoside kinase (ribokinase family)